MTRAWSRSFGGRVVAALVIVLFLLILVSAGSWLWVKSTQPDISDPPPGLLSILTVPIPDGPNAELIRRGRYLATAGDCASCHTRRGGRPYEGGLGIGTPFGTIYSANLTGDRRTGIGAWTPDQFFHALHDGVEPGGRHLYPALPYPYFTKLRREDSDAILAFLKTIPAVQYVPPPNRLPFPVNLRQSVIAWNAVNFEPGEYKDNPHMSAEWNRGAYLTEGLGHCGDCHSPKSVLGAELKGQAYRGAVINNSVAPDLTQNPRTGIGRWNLAEIVGYLRTGRNSHSSASGQMAEVVTYSTSLLSDSDLSAIATYLLSLPASPSRPSRPADASAMQAGSAIFSDACTGCHLTGGRGQPGLFPPLPGSAVAQQQDPTGVIRLILAGGRTAPTLSQPGFQSMPSFAWKLTDQQAADVSTYIRNSWGNRAPPVSAHQVAAVRSKLKLVKARPRDPR